MAVVSCTTRTGCPGAAVTPYTPLSPQLPSMLYYNIRFLIINTAAITNGDLVAAAPAPPSSWRKSCRNIKHESKNNDLNHFVSVMAVVSRAHRARDAQAPPLRRILISWCPLVHGIQDENEEAPGLLLPGRFISSVLSVRPQGEGGHEGVVLCKSLVFRL